MLAIQVMQQLLKDARMRDAADKVRIEVMTMMGDVERLRDRVSRLGSHFDQVSEDVRQVLISVGKIDKRAVRIGELDFSKDEAATETSRTVKPGEPELFPPQLARKIQAGE
jgi:DNA recombination protein RmuC